MAELHVWLLDKTDWVVASDEQDAWEVWEKWSREKRKYYTNYRWEKPDDDSPLTILLDESNELCGCRTRYDEEAHKANQPARDAEALRSLLAKQGAILGAKSIRVTRHGKLPGWLRNGHHESCAVGSQTKTCAEWAAENGRGFLCSTEY
jgi:hypothetical protein